MQKGLRVITLQGAIEKSPICYRHRNIENLNDWMVPKLFRILVVAMIFSPTVGLRENCWLLV
jgi:hypothetical protein